MTVCIYDNSSALGKAAGTDAADLIQSAIHSNGRANIILATGTSQFETLDHLVTATGIDWHKVIMFHLDEYIGLPVDHPASFRKYLQERFVSKVPTLEATYFIQGDEDPGRECARLNKIIADHSIDVALVGIGENGHLAFNDPPADFGTGDPFIVVDLDQKCREQQLREGWFKSIDEVPRKAISMSIKQILKSKNIICSVPGERKAIAVRNCLEEAVSNLYPASILQQHSNCTVYLDDLSASLLSKNIA